MGIFENPWVIITLFTLCSVVFATFGIIFAARGLKVSQERSRKSFLSVGRMEHAFKKAEKEQAERSLIYITVSSDHYLGANIKPYIFKDIERILLETFAADVNGDLCAYSDKSYVALLKHDADKVQETVESCCNKIHKCMIRHRALSVVDVQMGCLVKVGNQVDFDEAINRAKQACILARNEKQPYALWNFHRFKNLTQQINIENTIEKEIENNRFFLVYQPVVEAHTNKIVGAEVLARLRSETGRVLSPGSFLAAVDAVGLNGKFDYYIFEKNCKWIANNKKQRQRYQYTINFSRATLSEPDFVEKVTGIANKYGLDLSCLAVEILEDREVSGDAKTRMLDNLSQLKGKGMAVLLDDFGSGFTTFGDLQSLDVSVVKIDKTITQNAVTETGFIVLKNIITTSKDIGFKTLCEGVENAEQEAAALKAGVDLMQGFYYYKPMPVTELEKLLEK